MVIEVVLSEIRENSDVKDTAVHTALIERVRGNLADDVFRAGIRHLTKQVEKLLRLRSRVVRGDFLASDDVGDRPDKSGAAACVFENVFDKHGRRRFSVSAGDADEFELLLRSAVEV